MKKKLLMLFLAGAVSVTLIACGGAEKKGTDSRPNENAGNISTEISTQKEEEQNSQAEDANGQANTEQTSDKKETTENSVEDHTGNSTEETTEETTEATTEEDTEETRTESSDAPVNVEDITVASPDDGELLLKALFGTEDDETGFSYSFGYIDTFEIDGVEYYGYVWSWLVDNNHFSRISDILVQTDGSTVYQGEFDGEKWEINSDNMLEG